MRNAVPDSSTALEGEPRGTAEPPSSIDALRASLAHAEAEILSLSSEIVERYEELTLVYRLSDRLGAVLGERAIAALVLEEAARVLGATSGEIWLRQGDGMALAAAVPEGGPRAIDPPDEGAFAAVGSMRPWLREAAAGVESAIAIPLAGADGEPLGAMVLRGRPGGRSYRSGEVKLLSALAALTVAFIRNDRLAETARRAEARRREDEIARQIHRSLLPAAEPDFPGLDTAGMCRAAERIGGDYYGYIALADGSLGVAAADVSGHGVGAALYMAAAKGALHAEARRAFSPADLLRRTNDALLADFAQSDVFATAFFTRFYRGGRRFEYANGGHNPPLLVRADGRIEWLSRGGPALGVIPDALYEEETRSLEPDDFLVIYTDGLTEARDPARRFYGTARLLEVARGARGVPAAEVRRRLFEDLVGHCGTRPPQDDVTIVVLRCEPARARREAEVRG